MCVAGPGRPRGGALDGEPDDVGRAGERRADVEDHLDVGTEQFLLKLVDIGATTSEAEIFINSASTPAIDQGAWLSFDYELASLSGLAGTSNIQQIVIDLLTANDVGEVYIDNIYFYR